MDDLIVIILTLIIAAVGALGQLKKKKQPVQDSEFDDAPQDLFDLLGEKDSGRPVDFVEQQQVDYIDDQNTYSQHDKESHQTYGVVAEKEPEKAVTSKIHDEIKQPTKVAKQKKDFSLRKAVIYSEILNRKYI